MNYVKKTYQGAYSGLSPATWWLSLVMLINRSGTMVVPFMTLYLTEALHFGIAKAGIVMALFGCGAICGGFLGGRLTDKLGFYNVQLTALVCGGIMFIILGQMKSYTAICAITFLLAILNESFRPANSTAIAQYSSEANRTRSYALNRLAINLGWALGSALGGLIATHNYQLLFWIDGLTNIGAAFLLRAVLAPQRNTQTPSKHDVKKSNNVESGSPFKDRIYMVFTMLTILFAYSFYQLFTTIPVYYREKLHLTPFYIGSVMAVNGLIIALVEMVLVFKLEPKKKNLHIIFIGTIFIILSFLVFNILPGTGSVAIISMLLVTVGEMLTMPFMNSFMISRTTQGNRGQYAGLYTAAWSIAQVLGPFTGTQIVERFGFHVLWWWIVVMCAVTALGFKWLQIKLSPSAAIN